MHAQAIDFIHDLKWQDLSPDLQNRLRLLLLDLIGVAAAGSRTALARKINDHAASHYGAGSRAARLLFDGRMVSPVGAALASGMTIDALDAHDGHNLAKGHVGCGSLAALLALADAERCASTDEFLTGLAIGYEIGTRAGIALHRRAADYHCSGAWIAVAAAALGARILGLNDARSRAALGIAEFHGPRAPAIRTVTQPTKVKDASGYGAAAGVAAAYLAADGFTGAPALTMEEGEVADIWSDLGQRWYTMEQYLKLYPVCRWAQPSIEAVLNLLRTHDVSAADVQEIEVTTFHAATQLGMRLPRTTEQAQYSTAFPVAAALVRGCVDQHAVSESAFSDPEIRRLATSLRLVQSEEYTEAFPARRYAHVTLILKDGRSITSPRTEASGDHDRPLSPDVIREKYRSLARPVLGEALAGTVEETIAAMPIGGPLSPLLDQLLSRPPGHRASTFAEPSAALATTAEVVND